jgi:hypothetical protein
VAVDRARSTPAADTGEPRRQLTTVRHLALVDAVLLAVLVACSLGDLEVAVSIVGALHGGLFLTLVTVVGAGAAERLWSWWFPVAIVVSGGAVGAFVGERVVARRLGSGR